MYIYTHTHVTDTFRKNTHTCHLFCRSFLQKRPTLSRSLQVGATNVCVCHMTCLCLISRVHVGWLRLVKIIGLFCKRAL